MKKQKYCDNAYFEHNNNIGIPKCIHNIAEYKVEIIYTDYEKETMFLCGECLKNLLQYNKKYGHEITYKTI
jgi:hypothetical protein